MKAHTAKAAETALTEFSHFLKNKFSHVEPWTDYYVCNVYYHDDNCVGSHSDSDVHWGAVDGESVILSYTYEQAGIMLVYPSVSGEYHSDECLIDYCWTTHDIVRTKSRETQLIENGVIEAILLRPNSMLVMGGFFQGQLVHETIPDRVIRCIGRWMLNPTTASPPLPSDNDNYWEKLMRCKGWESTVQEYMRMQSDVFIQRTVFTLRMSFATTSCAPCR